MQYIHIGGSWPVAGSWTFRRHLTIARGSSRQSFRGRLLAMACVRCMGRELSVGILCSVVLSTMPAMVWAQPLLYGFGFFVWSRVLFAIFGLITAAFMLWLAVRACYAGMRGQRIQGGSVIVDDAPFEQQIPIPNTEREHQDTGSFALSAGGYSEPALRRRSISLNASMVALAESDTPIVALVPTAAAEASHSSASSRAGRSPMVSRRAPIGEKFYASLRSEAEVPSSSEHCPFPCPVCGRSPMVIRRLDLGDRFFACPGFPECRGTRPSFGSE